MYKEKTHSCSSSSWESLLEKVVERGDVEGDASDEEDGVGDDADDLGRPEKHVFW